MPSILRKLLGDVPQLSAVEGRQVTHPAVPAQWLLDLLGLRDSPSGREVTHHTALAWSAISLGLRRISETIASLPLKIYERLEPRGKRPREEHPLWSLLHESPNDEQTAFEFFAMAGTHPIVFGNHYSEIVRNNRGEISELWPLNPDRVKVERDNAKNIVYRIFLPPDEGGPMSAVLRADQVMHVPGFSLTGLLGISLLNMHREVIGLGLATEEYASRFFGQGASPSGVFQHPTELSEKAHKRLKDSLDRQISGLSRSHRILLLEEGMKWQQTSVDPEKAQFLGLRTFQVREAARILSIPPHMLYDLERATFSNIEQQSIEFVVYTLVPWLRRWEQRIHFSLLGRKDRSKLFAEFNVSGLVRGDIQTRYAAYAQGRQWGWLSVNDIRELENLNPVEGGDEYLQPLNMGPLGEPPPQSNGGPPNRVAGELEGVET